MSRVRRAVQALSGRAPEADWYLLEQCLKQSAGASVNYAEYLHLCGRGISDETVRLTRVVYERIQRELKL